MPMVRSGSAVRGCVLLVAAALLAGCTRVIAGTMHPARPGGEEAAPIPVADLLIEPDHFPQQYPAAVLDDASVDRVLQDVDGVPDGSVVTPPECAPPPAPRDTAAVQGFDDQDASSLIVSVARPAPLLRARADQLGACPSFTSVRGPDTYSVTVTLLAPPPVDADDTYAVEQTVTEQPSGQRRRTMSLAAQVGDVLLLATWSHAGTQDVAPDTQSLDTLFTDAVLKVRRVGGP
jgi:hypothetical protein